MESMDTADTALIEPTLAALSLKEQVEQNPNTATITVTPASPSLSPPTLAPASSNGRVAIATAENEPGSFSQIQEQQQQPTKVPERTPSTTPSIKSHSSSPRSHQLAEIPSAYDLYSTPSPGHKNGARSIDSSSSDAAPSSSGHSSINESKHRFERLPNGSHHHNLSAPKRHQFLSSQVRRFKDLLEGKKDKEELLQHHQHHLLHQGHHLKREAMEHPLSLMKEKIQDFETDSHLGSALSSKKKLTLKEEFLHKYGDLQQVIGKGAFGTVRLSVKKNPETGDETVFAVKKSYMRRLTSEFCIASSLKHVNVIQTLDLLQLHSDAYSEVMEYCAGGDMHTLIASASSLPEAESNCFFSQLVNGVAFLHSMGVVHRDLKPENLLLTADGCLKIADFGNSEVFRMPWEKKVRSSASIRGSGPFIAPEEFTSKTFDARKVDMWSCGIIYMCMRLGRYNWAEASKGDPIWESFQYKIEQAREAERAAAITGESRPPHWVKFVNIRALEQATHTTFGWPDHISEVMDKLLEIDPKQRWQAGHVLESQWLQEIDNCHQTEPPADQVLDESDFDEEPSQRVGSKVVQQDAAVTGCSVVKDAKTHLESNK
ncbi:serine/threonine-protein kinase HAL4/sat4 [Gryganskiella cystojenkinii]|nr:serine/threonine-protein kinase HAL4/sat4 [Gryganskiella cystojenkinii]